jgi:GT2 family glycosyltransferase
MKVDVVILSAVKTRALTIQGIETLKASEEEIDFNVIVIEDSLHYYSNVTNLKIDEEFNYNRFMNLGAKTSDADYIVFCNNDLIFHKGWFTEMLKYDFPCMSPRSMRDFRQWSYAEDVITGTGIGTVFSGWCFVLKREIWEQIGGLDEDFKFWYADNATVEQLKNIGITPTLITQSYVEHVGSQTLIQEDPMTQRHLTDAQSTIFYNKYGRN